MPSVSLLEASDRYLRLVADSRSENTHRTYTQAIHKFLGVLKHHKVQAAVATPDKVSPEWLTWYVSALKPLSAATESLFLTALVGFYEYLAAEEAAPLNLIQVRSMLKRRQRKAMSRLPQFPREQIETVISYVNSVLALSGDEQEHLRRLRNRAFIYTLSDTGLRISEACRLTRGQFDWAEGRAIVTIKGGRESVVRFSERSSNAIKSYLSARAELDGACGRLLPSCPFFSCYYVGAGKNVFLLSTVGARNIMTDAVVGAFG